MKRTVRVVRVRNWFCNDGMNFRNWFAGTPWGGIYGHDFREIKSKPKKLCSRFLAT